MASTINVIKAVVKNMPKEYFIENEKLYESVNTCFYLWTKKCKMLFNINLLNKTIPNIAANTLKIAQFLIDLA